MAALVYVAGLGPAFGASSGSTRSGVLEVRAVDPEARLVVAIGPCVTVHGGPCPSGTPTLVGAATDLVEALSFRIPLVTELDDADRWLLGGLDRAFDLA